jgi:hypothetical protein
VPFLVTLRTMGNILPFACVVGGAVGLPTEAAIDRLAPIPDGFLTSQAALSVATRPMTLRNARTNWFLAIRRRAD